MPRFATGMRTAAAWLSLLAAVFGIVLVVPVVLIVPWVCSKLELLLRLPVWAEFILILLHVVAKGEPPSADVSLGALDAPDPESGIDDYGLVSTHCTRLS